MTNPLRQQLIAGGNLKPRLELQPEINKTQQKKLRKKQQSQVVQAAKQEKQS